MTDLKPFSTWHHPRTNSTYTVLGLACCSTNGPDEGKYAVVYISHTHGKLKYRDVDQFLEENRFVRVSP